MMKKYLFTTIFFLQFFAVGCMASAATPQDSTTVWGNVRDAFNQNYLSGVRVELLSADGGEVLAIDSCKDYTLKYPDWMRQNIRESSRLSAYILYKFQILPGKYRLRFSCRNYDSQDMDIDVPAKKHGRTLKKWQVDDVVLQRRAERQLGEAVVTATKIMMVNKGDTLVFNADYFQLAQGNMLDKLISMIPGLEIKPGGQIFYQGNRLHSLTVNGKDFFKGDANVALQNLPAYMVNTINIYHKDEDDAYLRTRKDSTDTKPNAIDIRLKKEYNRGWITNYELAGGPAFGQHDAWRNGKYLARIFALCFTNRSRLGIIGNFNNINDATVASPNGAWLNSWEPENGVTKLAFGAVTFHTESKKKTTNYGFDLKGTHETTDQERLSSGTSFLPSGDVFNRAKSENNNDRYHVVLTNTFVKREKNVYFNSPLDLEYWHCRIRNQALSAQFSGDPLDAYAGASLDSIFLGPESARLKSLMVNRMQQQTLSKIQDFMVTYYPTFSVTIPGLNLYLHNSGSLTYKNHKDKKFEHYSLLYNAQTDGNDDRKNRFYEQPAHSFSANYWSIVSFGEAFQNKFLQETFRQLEYAFDYQNSFGKRDLFNLTHLPETDEPQKLGALPSVNNWREMTIDLQNSYHQRQISAKHLLVANLSFGKVSKAGQLVVKPSVEFHHQQLNDTRYLQRVNKHYALFSGWAQYNISRSHDNTVHAKDGKRDIWYSASYGLANNLPFITYLADVRDDTDPLRISLGNPNLRSSKTHAVNMEFGLERTRKDKWTLSLDYSKSVDDVAMGYTYNAQTGVYTYRPQNIDGNWTAGLNSSYYIKFGKNKMWNLSSNTRWNYQHSVDLLNEELSTVHNHQVSESVSLYTRFGKVATVSLRGNVKWYHATSERDNYRTRNTYDISCGPNMSVHLPGDLSLETDFNVYKRCGYDDHSMNDCNLIWNASLSWDFDFRKSSYWGYHTVEYLKVRKRGGTGARPWTFRVICHDLLQQLSNIRRVINAQGITETRYNAVPSYVLFSLSYRFSKFPKKK